MKKPPEDTRSDARPAGNLIQRRRLVKVVAAGGGVATGVALIPSKWTQPIIESVTLPVHAQTTNQSATFSAPLPESTDVNLVRPPRSVVDSLMAPAHAAVDHADIQYLFGACNIESFHPHRVDVQINTLVNGSYFGSIANPSTLNFDVTVTGPLGSYIVGVFVDILPIPTVVGGIVIGNGGSLPYDALLNGPCSPAGGAVTPTSSG